MIIEFVGLPASGKTSLAKKILLYKSINGIVINYPLFELYVNSWYTRNILKIGHVIKYAFTNYGAFKTDFTNIMKSEQIGRFNLIKISLNYLFFISSYKKYKESKEIILFDEGLFHNLWAISFASKIKDIELLCNKFIEREILPDMVVFVDCKTNELIKRLKLRSSNTRIEKSEDLERAIENAQRVLNQILERHSKIFKKDNIVFIRIDNSNFSDLAQNASVIRSSLIRNKL